MHFSLILSLVMTDTSDMIGMTGTDISLSYLGFDRTLYQNLHLNLCIHIYFIAYLLDLVLWVFWFVFYRKSKNSRMNLEFGTIAHNLYTSSIQPV